MLDEFRQAISLHLPPRNLRSLLLSAKSLFEIARNNSELDPELNEELSTAVEVIRKILCELEDKVTD